MIALIAKARCRASDHRGQTTEDRYGGQIKRELSVVRCPSSDLRFRLGVEKTSFASNASGDLSGQAPDPRLVARDRTTEDRRQQDRQSRLPSIRTHATRPSTECASSSQCQISETENGRRRTDSSPSAFRPAKRPGARHAREGETDFCIGRRVQAERRKPARCGSSAVRSPSSENGGARRDRTDDLMLAKHALSQLSYGPGGGRRSQDRRQKRPSSSAVGRWWAWEDLNLRPHAYQARALTN